MPKQKRLRSARMRCDGGNREVGLYDVCDRTRLNAPTSKIQKETVRHFKMEPVRMIIRMLGTGSSSCPVSDFVISSAGSLDSATAILVQSVYVILQEIRGYHSGEGNDVSLFSSGFR
jgi:hypothetical protein